MNQRQRVIIISIVIFLIILICLGITYSYFLTKIKGNNEDKSISIQTANLVLEYGDGNGIIEVNNVVPGDYIKEKSFTVTNRGNSTVENYVVLLENVLNNIYYREDLTYTLNCESVDMNTGENRGTCKGLSKTLFPRDEDIMVTNTIDVGIMHKYILKVNYRESNSDQSRDMNKVIAAKVNIYDRRSKIPYLIDEENTIVFLNKINELENLAQSYLGDSAKSIENSKYMIDKTKWLVFSTISKLKYDSDSWTIVAGAKDNSFLTYLSNEGFDINVFNNMSYNSSDSGDTSEVVHLSAALAAFIYNTDSVYNLIMKENDYNNLAGWAGDLQTLIANNLLKQISDQNDYNQIYNKMLELIGKSGTYFDSDDLYADIDAANLYKLLDTNKSIKEVMQTYFSINYKERFNLFINSISSVNDYETLKNTIYPYTQYKTTWPLYNGVSEFSSTVATASRDAFADYIWYKANLKKLDIFSEILEYKKGTTVNFNAEYITLDGTLDKTLSNDDYTWRVTNVDGTTSISTINNGVLSIASNEVADKLLITITLNKSNKVIVSKVININD